MLKTLKIPNTLPKNKKEQCSQPVKILLIKIKSKIAVMIC